MIRKLIINLGFQVRGQSLPGDRQLVMAMNQKVSGNVHCHDVSTSCTHLEGVKETCKSGVINSFPLPYVSLKKFLVSFDIPLFQVVAG